MCMDFNKLRSGCRKKVTTTSWFNDIPNNLLNHTRHARLVPVTTARSHVRLAIPHQTMMR